jgi:hypothetical protein
MVKDNFRGCPIGEQTMGRRFRPAGAGKESLRQVGVQLAERLGLPLSDVRYATYDFHDGQRWTIRARWERRDQASWLEVDARDVPNSYDR